MVKSFISYLSDKLLLSPKDKILLTVSGGVDSVVMAHLFAQTKYNFAIAHCNFKLRDEDSDIDEEFVKNLANNLKVELFTKSFNTKAYAKRKNISIQMAARELRYDWFNELVIEKKFDYIATAHHLDDNIETVLINFIRGSGISGLRGILPKNNNIIRPLLFASRKQIENYATARNIIFRYDKSNDSDKYIRNKIRHNILPVLYEINPSFGNTFNNTVDRLKDIEEIYKTGIENQINKVIKHDDDIVIDIKKLLKLSPAKTFLYEFLTPYGFNYTSAEDIISIINDQSGKTFLSSTHKLIKDRNNLIVQKNNVANDIVGKIEKDDEYILFPVKLKIAVEEKVPGYNLITPKTIGLFDFNKIKFPLTIRKWKQGDSFYPFGMVNKKKVSDFFINEKFSILDKEKTYLLCSEDKILWIIGHRTDNRFKVNASTKKVLKITLL